MEKLWTTSEVAQYLGLTESEVEGLVRDGKLTGYKLGGKFLRFRPEQVQALKPTLSIQRTAPVQVAMAGAVSWPERLRDFLYFYDLYVVSFVLLAGLVVYLVASG